MRRVSISMCIDLCDADYIGYTCSATSLEKMPEQVRLSSLRNALHKGMPPRKTLRLGL
jgi:hypothetical protein